MKLSERFFKPLVFAISLLLITLAGAQDFNPGEDEIFKEDEVTEIHVTLSAADKAFFLNDDNRNSDEYKMADVQFVNSELDHVTVPNVGIRLRGNTARNHPKRSFKIDFKEFGGERYESYKKINLKPNVNDPSVVRELLSMHLFRQMDVPAPRIAPAILYMNEEYMGVYLMVEQIDDEFVDKRFGKEVGWLYKCAYSATLEDNGQVFDQGLYESKMNEETDTRAQLDNFVDVLNNTPSSNFETEISKIFQVDRFIRYLAVEAIVGHWDGYSYLNNNYYMYYDEDEGKFEFIAYDTDNTWGIDWIDRDWANRDLTHFYRHSHPRPLTSRILSVPAWENRYYAYLNKVFNEYFNEAYLIPKFNELETLLDPYVAVDDRFDDSFGFSHQNFKDAFDYATSGHVEYGLRGYLETRRSSGIGSYPTVILSNDELNGLQVYPNPSRDGIFDIKGVDIRSISARDINGKTVAFSVRELAQDHVQVKLTESGLYFLQLDGMVKRVWVD